MSAATIDRNIVSYKAEIAKAYSDALSIQNACNFSGIAISLGRLAEPVCRDLEFHVKGGTADKRRHPVFVLFASKLHDLAGLGISDSDKYGLAYRFAEKVAQGVLTVGSEPYREALAAYYAAWDEVIRQNLARMGWESV